MTKYNRNINVKKYSSVEEIYDSVNNDPKRPGYQIIYLDQTSVLNKTGKAWYDYLRANGFTLKTISEKYPKIGNTEYLALIIKATPEQALALKICF